MATGDRNYDIGSKTNQELILETLNLVPNEIITAHIKPNNTLTTIINTNGRGYLEFRVTHMTVNGEVVLTIDGKEHNVSNDGMLYEYSNNGTYYLPRIYFNESIKLQVKSGADQYTGETRAVVILT